MKAGHWVMALRALSPPPSPITVKPGSAPLPTLYKSELPRGGPAHSLTFFQQVGDVGLVSVPHPDLSFVSEKGLLLWVIDQRIEEEILEDTQGGGGRPRRPVRSAGLPRAAARRSMSGRGAQGKKGVRLVPNVWRYPEVGEAPQLGTGAPRLLGRPGPRPRGAPRQPAGLTDKSGCISNGNRHLKVFNS